jgi:hypothetical protein
MLDIKPLLKHQLLQWGEEYFNLVSALIINLKQLICKKEYDIKQGLNIPFVSLKEKVEKIAI